MNRQRIAFIEFSPSGGLFQFSAQLAEALAERGHETHMLTGPDPELHSGHPDFHLHPVLPTWHPGDRQVLTVVQRKARRAFRGLKHLLAWLVVLHRLRRLRPDVVLWSGWRFSIDAVGVLATSTLLPRVTLAIVSHEPRLRKRSDTTRTRSGPVLSRALPAAWRRMDVVYVLGEQVRKDVLEAWAPTAPIVRIPHGDERALLDGRPLPSVSATEPVVLMFGVWTAYKGIDLLLDCMPEVRRRVPGARLVLAGAVAGVDLPRLLIKAESVGGVSARPGYVPKDEIPDLFGTARVIALPYLRASQSGVVHLAYTFGRPVVASRVGELPAVVRDGVTGLLVPPNDRDALTDALVALLRDPLCAQRLGAAGAEWLATEASWARVAAQVESGLAETKRPSPSPLTVAGPVATAAVDAHISGQEHRP